MKYNTIAHSDLKVSQICLGTMTFGAQNSESQAHQQLDYALAHGVNFIDTAEMYPVPPEAKNQGDTERFIGSWIAKRRDRSDFILASKVAGPRNMPHIREGSGYSKTSIRQALLDSLSRLNTDYLDLYQLHWPERITNCFGQLNYAQNQANYDKQAQINCIGETLEALSQLKQEGLVRHIGLSNETPWGVMRFLQLSELQSMARMITIQNPYNLLNRSFEVGLSEICDYEGIGLLAYSPLAFGVLSGKYLNGQKPEGARLSLFARFQRYNNPQALAATQAYVTLAQQHDLDPAQMALAFVNSRSFVASNIIGATTLEQLKDNINSVELSLSAEVLDGIEAIAKQYSNPAP
ncbi:Protein tas [Vibrio stylophorae]|uniref:Protein tas n=1 Tax=Vibrio stylophorae TaxID=659351 RepID=A0ABN8DQ03_9VIBR|nr:NADP(H)-dependent aldo-keto reductase [Vibrio stylophorae]CAH0532682.1 Protein tas [Vibrio stylophorae]